MQNKVIIPVSVVFELDDVGWDNGRDLRLSGMASRSGLPRNHAKEDYEVLDLLGKATGNKTTVALCLGDWDKDNLLRGEVGLTHDPYGWDRASEINIEKTMEYKEILDSSKYIEFACHGLLHGIYGEDGKQINDKGFVLRNRDKDGKAYLTLADNFNRTIELFFKIYESWGFKKPVECFIVGGGIGGMSEDVLDKATAFLKSWGFKYWTNGGYPFEGPIGVYNDIVCLNQTGKIGRDYAPWNAYDDDPRVYGDFIRLGHPNNSNVFGMHWTNLLRFNPKKNKEVVPLWADYFARQAEVFGSMNARDLASSVNQQFYNSYASLEFCDGVISVDLTKTLAKKPKGFKNEFYVSFKKNAAPKGCVGGSISLFEEHKEFNTYKILHTGDRVDIII